MERALGQLRLSFICELCIQGTVYVASLAAAAIAPHVNVEALGNVPLAVFVEGWALLSVCGIAEMFLLRELGLPLTWLPRLWEALSPWPGLRHLAMVAYLGRAVILLAMLAAVIAWSR